MFFGSSKTRQEIIKYSYMSQEDIQITTRPAPKIKARFFPLEVLDLPRSKQRSDETIGQRLSRFRRDRGITQAELADMLEVAQPMISGYERDTLRLHGELIVKLTRILSVTADELLGLEHTTSTVPVKNKRLLRKIQDLDRLPRRDQEAVLRTIDAFLQKAG